MFKLGIAFVLLLSALSGWAQESAEKQYDWRILVLPEQQPHALEAGHVAYRKVNQSINQYMGDNAFDISLDPNLPECLRYLCENLTRADQVDLIKGSTLKIDLAVFYSITILERPKPAGIQRELGVTGHMIDLTSGRKLPLWSDDPIPTERISPDCVDACFEQELAKFYGRIASDTGYVLDKLLRDYERRYEYLVKLHDFAWGELQTLKESLAIMDPSGSVREETDLAPPKRQLLHHTVSQSFNYTSHLAPPEFKSTLELALDDLGYGIAPHYHHDYTHEYKRTALPYLLRYCAGVVLLIIFLYLVYAISLRQKHRKIIKQHQQFHRAQQGFDHIQNARLPLVPKPAEWPAQQKAFLNDIEQAERLVKQALDTGSKGNYQDAFGLLDQAAQLNADNGDVANARQTLENYIKGDELFKQASEQLHTDPTTALNNFKQAVTLNPLLTDQVKQLEATAHGLIRQGLITETLQALQFVDVENPYAALVSADRALAKLENVEGMHVDRSELLKAKTDMLAKLNPIKGTLLGRGGLEGYTFFSDNILSIGRKSDNRVGELAIGYKRLSRMGKQNRIERELDSFSVVDLGSANGSWLDANLITDSKPLILSAPLHSLNMGGRKNPPEQGLCQLSLQKPKVGDASLLIQIDPDAYCLADKQQLKDAWPSLEYDVASRWVMLLTLGVGVTEGGELDVGCFNSEPMLKLAIKDQQYWLEPVLHQGEHKVFINSVKIDTEVPLLSGARVQIAQQTFSLELVEEQKDITQCQ